MSKKIITKLLVCALTFCVPMSADQIEINVPVTASGKPAEGAIEPFLGEPLFDLQQIFRGQRFPNVVVTVEGTVLATWGRDRFLIRRSEDGGESWDVESMISAGVHGGGVTVDEATGKIFVFIEDELQPNTPLTIYLSSDDGKTWSKHVADILPDINDNLPSMHMGERGITLRHGEHAGRLLRPSRYYAESNDRRHWPQHYNNAIFSDDSGKTWHTSAPFPAYGTGEGALAELSCGRIYYNSRRHLSTDGLNPRWRHIAWSDDGGNTWAELSVSDVLPDGSQHRDYGLMGGLVRLPVQGRDILVFSNIISQTGRRNGHVWASFDGGRTWPIKRMIEQGTFAYSSMAAGRPGTASEGWIYLMYEGEGGAWLARFNLSWLLEGEVADGVELPAWIEER